MAAEAGRPLLLDPYATTTPTAAAAAAAAARTVLSPPGGSSRSVGGGGCAFLGLRQADPGSGGRAVAGVDVQ